MTDRNDIYKQIENVYSALDNVKTSVDILNMMVVKKLNNKTQECEELEKRNKFLFSEVRDNISKGNWVYERCKKRAERYRKALKEIEDVWAKDEDGDYDFVKWQILDIINKAKGESNEQNK